MNLDNNLVLITIIAITIIVMGLCYQSNKKDGYHSRGTKNYKNFNNADYSYSNPDLTREDHYYACLKSECKNNTHDYPCLEKCHLKSYRKGMKTKDHADWVCYNYRHDEDAYYKCLDNVYADYKYP